MGFVLSIATLAAAEAQVLGKCSYLHEPAASLALLAARRLQVVGTPELPESDWVARIFVFSSPPEGESSVTIHRNTDGGGLVTVLKAARNVWSANITPSGKVRVRPRLPRVRKRSTTLRPREVDDLESFLTDTVKQADSAVSFTGPTIVLMTRTAAETRCAQWSAASSDSRALTDFVFSLAAIKDQGLPAIPGPQRPSP